MTLVARVLVDLILQLLLICCTYSTLGRHATVSESVDTRYNVEVEIDSRYEALGTCSSCSSDWTNKM